MANRLAHVTDDTPSVIQLTLSPYEGVWLYTALALGYYITMAACKEVSRMDMKRSERRAAELLPEAVRSMRLIADGSPERIFNDLATLVERTGIAGFHTERWEDER